jgi:hypothetical protein
MRTTTKSTTGRPNRRQDQPPAPMKVPGDLRRDQRDHEQDIEDPAACIDISIVGHCHAPGEVGTSTDVAAARATVESLVFTVPSLRLISVSRRTPRSHMSPVITTTIITIAASPRVNASEALVRTSHIAHKRNSGHHERAPERGEHRPSLAAVFGRERAKRQMHPSEK